MIISPGPSADGSGLFVSNHCCTFASMHIHNLSISYLIFLFCGMIVLVGCKQTSDNNSPDENLIIQSEIEVLSKTGQDLPLVVSDEDVENCKQAVELARAIENRQTELNCLIRLFQLQNRKENFRDALQTGNLALKLSGELGSKSDLAEIHKLFGKTYYHISSFHKSFENFEKSLKIFQELNDTVNQQDVLNMQGNIYFSWEDLDMAFDYYSRTFELGKLRNDNIGIARSFTNMGIVFAAQSQQENLSKDSLEFLSDQAVQYIQNAIRFIDKTDKDVMRAEILNNLSIIYREREELENALQTILEARTISKPLSDRVYSSASLSYASILLEMDSVDRAEKELINSLELSREKELNSQVINILEFLSNISSGKGNFENAFVYQKEHSKLSDSIFNLDYKKKIDAIKLASEMETVVQQQKLKQQQSYYQTMIIVTGLVFIIIVISLLYSRLRARNTNIKLENSLLNERLETRNKELTTRIMALIQRNELEKEIVQKLNLLKPKMKQENQKDVDKITHSLSFKQDDQLWKEFEVRFEGVHQEFFSKLSNSYPDLTTNEKRLCAFLYLDMSSKDISAITGQSIRALNVARTRLRKKFNLTNDIKSLSGFLNSL